MTDHTDTDLQKLREAAEKATPGPWTTTFSMGHRVTVQTGDPGRMPVAMTQLMPLAQTMPGRDEANAAFIALANPATILSLLDQLSKAHADLERAEGEREYLGAALGGLLVRMDILDPDYPGFTGPQLLLAANDGEEWIKLAKSAEAALTAANADLERMREGLKRIIELFDYEWPVPLEAPRIARDLLSPPVTEREEQI